MSWKLLNPGPVTLTPRVREALLQPDLCHREPEFTTLIDDVRRGLVTVDPAVAACIPLVLAGSGTAAVEAMVQTLVPRADQRSDQHEGHAVVVDNGVYGAHGRHAHRVGQARAGGEERVDRRHRPRGRGRGVARRDGVVGRAPRNDDGPKERRRRPRAVVCAARRAAVARRCEQLRRRAVAARAGFDRGVCVDGEQVPAWHHRRVLRARRPAALRAAERGHQRVFRPAPRPGAGRVVGAGGGDDVHPAVHSLYALQQAVAEFTEGGGREARFARYARHSAQVRAALEDAGYRALLPAAVSSVCLQTFWLKDGVGYDVVHDRLKERGFVIYAGQGPLASRTLRIAVMGDLDDADIARLTTALSEIA